MVDVVAELVASVAQVRVGPGQQVGEGETLLVVESMKMAMPVPSPAAGTVTDVWITAGDVIQEGDVLVRIRPA